MNITLTDEQYKGFAWIKNRIQAKQNRLREPLGRGKQLSDSEIFDRMLSCTASSLSPYSGEEYRDYMEE